MEMVPEGLNIFLFWMLVATSFLGSFISTAAGIGGGVTMLAVMAQVMPPLALIPVHGLVQLGSNISRAVVMIRHIDLRFIGWFFVGGLLGAAVGVRVVTALPVSVLQSVLGLFILYSVWGPMPTGGRPSRTRLIAGGGITTLASMFVGASGPLAMVIVKAFDYDRFTKVGTFSGVMVVQHGLKGIVFGIAGFAFLPYLPLVAFMVAAGFLGTLVGKGVLLRQNEDHFGLILNIILTLLALRLLWQAGQAYMTGVPA